jgi:hypothetical protein
MNYLVVVSRNVQIEISIDADSGPEAVESALSLSEEIEDKYWHEESYAYIVDIKE